MPIGNESIIACGSTRFAARSLATDMIVASLREHLSSGIAKIADTRSSNSPRIYVCIEAFLSTMI